LFRAIFRGLRRLFHRRKRAAMPLEGCSLLFGVWLDGQTPCLILETPRQRWRLKLTPLGDVDHYATPN